MLIRCTVLFTNVDLLSLWKTGRLALEESEEEEISEPEPEPEEKDTGIFGLFTSNLNKCLCCMCGSAGSSTSFVHCYVCCESFHWFCSVPRSTRKERQSGIFVCRWFDSLIFFNTSKFLNNQFQNRSKFSSVLHIFFLNLEDEWELDLSFFSVPIDSAVMRLLLVVPSLVK